MAETSQSPIVRVLFIGDVVGTGALAMVTKMLPTLASKYASDFIIVNGENVAEGKSLTKKQANEIFAAGAKVITTGNHVWDRWDARGLMAEDRRVLRPANYPRENAGAGYAVGETKGWYCRWRCKFAGPHVYADHRLPVSRIALGFG